LLSTAAKAYNARDSFSDSKPVPTPGPVVV
jgi:hypothetical protein